MDELREKIMAYLQEWFDGREPGFHEAHSTALSVAKGIVRARCPEASYLEVYNMVTEATEEFLFSGRT